MLVVGAAALNMLVTIVDIVDVIVVLDDFVAAVGPVCAWSVAERSAWISVGAHLVLLLESVCRRRG